MRFYSHLPNFSTAPSKQHLLDVALILSIVPHLTTLSSLMILYLFGALLGLWLIKEVRPIHQLFFGLLGGVALALSFYDSLTFVGLSRLNIFVSLIISLLIVAVVLQRLGNKINFYLLISPALFLALSYFFHNTIMMLFYAVFTLFIFLLLLLWQRMQSSFMAAFKMALGMFAFALPVIVLLFMTFPRISFKTRDFGFKAEQTIRTGHDGIMHMGGDALLVPSKRVVMEVAFEGEMPPEQTLYFRGSALYIDKTDRWEPRKKNKPISLKAQMPQSRYHVTLYPHQKKWLYFIDHPQSVPKEAKIDADGIITSNKNVEDVLRYEGSSTLNSLLNVSLTPAQHSYALQFDATRDERTLRFLNSLHVKDLNSLIEAFKSLNLRYSLKPTGIQPSDPVDSFLFDSKQGYCVHFASAFATMARMTGIPARIITGFKASYTNRIENYLVVKEEDAHAWVEVYLKGKGWQRIETTAFATGVALRIENGDTVLTPKISSPFWHRMNLTYMYARYVLQSWILDYNRSKQMQLLKELLSNASFALGAVGAFGVLIALGYLLSNLRHQRSRIHPAKKALFPLLASLKKEGFEVQNGETIEAFLKRVYEHNGDEKLLHVSKLYNRIRYGKSNNYTLLKTAVGNFKQ